ncbi:MAG: hypothetical protein ACI31N_07715, partial [Lacticaseibacillus absianus]
MKAKKPDQQGEFIDQLSASLTAGAFLTPTKQSLSVTTIIIKNKKARLRRAIKNKVNSLAHLQEKARTRLFYYVEGEKTWHFNAEYSAVCQTKRERDKYRQEA